ncbi:MAG: hypothetical protein ACM3S1_05420, partial [Hyphomicrobiales bacterium]
MTVQDILDALSDYGFTDTTTTRKLEKINATLYDITSREPWPFMEQSLDLNFDGTNAKPSNLPTDFQSVLDIVDLSTGVKLQPLRLQEADAGLNLQLTAGGTPMYYYFLGNELRVSPIPSAGTGTHRMRYIRIHPAVTQTDPESAILVPKQHHEVVLFGTLVKLYDLEDDTDLSVRFQQLYEKKYNDMRGAVWMRQYDRPDHIV